MNTRRRGEKRNVLWDAPKTRRRRRGQMWKSEETVNVDRKQKQTRASD